jgi:hypothetical protein
LVGVIPGMWWQSPEPANNDERRAEIRRLEGIRDRLLEKAPRSFYMKRFILPVMMAMFLLALGQGIWKHPNSISPGSVLFSGVFFLLLGHAIWKIRKAPAPGDRWGYSDALGYEGDSPRELQERIDRLRAQMAEERAA